MLEGGPAIHPGPKSPLFWRRGRDSNPRYRCQYARLAIWCLRPLGHLSALRKPSLKHYRQRWQIERDLCLISIVHRGKLVSRGRIRRESGPDSHQRALQQNSTQSHPYALCQCSRTVSSSWLLTKARLTRNRPQCGPPGSVFCNQCANAEFDEDVPEMRCRRCWQAIWRRLRKWNLKHVKAG